jgi:peptidoglycan/xylan/chitin deacetylase (PgdA/CDA1 family)
MPSNPKITVLLSIDFDAVSGWLGTGSHPSNTLSDYSQGLFSGKVGVPRLLRLFSKLGISSKVTWFIPGHSAESFPDAMNAIVTSGAEIAGHGYCHEGAYQLTEEQERDVISKSIEVLERISGSKVRGWRGPLYQVREKTIGILEGHGLLYDSSLAGHDSEMYWLPKGGPKGIERPKFEAGVSASSWMKPLPDGVVSVNPKNRGLVEIPGNWYMEDMTPLQFWPHTENSHGYVDTRTIEWMWKERYQFIVEEAREKEEGEITVFPLILHPDTSGMAHVLPMIERFLKWLLDRGEEVEFLRYAETTERWKESQ